jgi:hypothetical protein
LVEDMTVQERQRLLTGNFKEMYTEFWGRFQGMDEATYKDAYREARSKFLEMKKGFSINHYHCSWASLVSAATSTKETPVREFPKGKKQHPPPPAEKEETDFDTAIREFTEETGFSPSSYILVPYTKPFEMRIYGMDGMIYDHLFYIVKFHRKENVENRPSPETSGVMWGRYDDLMKDIWPADCPQRQLLVRVHNHLLSLYETSK